MRHMLSSLLVARALSSSCIMPSPDDLVSFQFAHLSPKMMPVAKLKVFTVLTLSALSRVESFSLHSLNTWNAEKVTSSPNFVVKHQRASSLASAASNEHDDNAAIEPQAIATGYSQNPDLSSAIKEAATAALKSLPAKLDRNQIDLGLVYISSIYDGQSTPTTVVPEIVDTVNDYYGAEGDSVLQKLIGCYSGGLVGCKEPKIVGEVNAVESEGASGVVINFCLLPDTTIKTFHVLGDDVPDDIGRISPEYWKSSVGLRNFNAEPNDATFMLLPSPSFQNDLDDFLRGMSMSFPGSTIFGGIASTVSSLSRARLFRYDAMDSTLVNTLADGCVGIAIAGDVQAKVMVSQGAKPVGGVYRIVSGQDSTISAIQLDETATSQLEDTIESLDKDDEEEDETDKKKIAAAAYAKAVIPKPVLAEANYLMKTLSDDDQAFMRKSILVGLENSGGIAKTPNELLRLAAGQGHRFTVHQVASAGMKDGSITLPLGTVEIELGGRLRFFVRDGTFAKEEVDAIWTGYKKKELEQTFLVGEGGKKGDPFVPSGCFFFPSLDRGTKLFGGRPGYESKRVTEYLPNIPTIGGFFTNGCIAALDEDDSRVMVHGSASCYAVIGSKTKRPSYSAAQAATENMEAKLAAEKAAAIEKRNAEEDEKRTSRAKGLAETSDEKPAPRAENGELILKRREVHSGRALTVSNVEWSVVENMATPTSALEGFMWDKETEIDRQRERVPLSNLVSQCRLSDLDPSKPKPRDWIGPIKLATKSNDFVIIPELKRLEPSSGSLRKRFDLSKITKQFTLAGAPALSVNCDSVLFGGSIDELLQAREAASKAILDFTGADEGVIAPPLLASDLLLYPYQLYKLRLAGADAVNLIAGALASKDLLYLSKIAASLKMQIIASVTSEVQIESISKLGKGSVSAIVVSNRDLETFGFDDSGEQALSMLKSDAMKEFKKLYDGDIPVLVEGRVGIIEMEGQDGLRSTQGYIRALKSAGANGAIVGQGIATVEKEDIKEVLESMSNA